MSETIVHFLISKKLLFMLKKTLLTLFSNLGRCARKTEVALWPHLFSVVGSPRQLFMECMGSHDLETAASYLLILQNLEPPAVAQSNATILLDAALDRCAWDLAKELVSW